MIKKRKCPHLFWWKMKLVGFLYSHIDRLCSYIFRYMLNVLYRFVCAVSSIYVLYIYISICVSVCCLCAGAEKPEIFIWVKRTLKKLNARDKIQVVETIYICTHIYPQTHTDTYMFYTDTWKYCTKKKPIHSRTYPTHIHIFSNVCIDHI